MMHEIVMIGSGNLATALGLKLKTAGHHFRQVYSRNIEHSKRLAKQLDAVAIDNIVSVADDASLYIIAIKDDAILKLSSNLKFLSNDVLICHGSGVNSLEIIDAYFINRGLLYPLQSFSLDKNANWDGVPVFIEGNAFALDKLNQLAKGIASEIYQMNDQIRTHLHLASVFANNFSNFNLLIAKKIIENTSIPFKAIRSLMNETIAKAFEMHPIKAQTGPAKRGDLSTIDKHLRLLVQEFPEYRSLYKKYSQTIEQEFKHENIGTNSTP